MNGIIDAVSPHALEIMGIGLTFVIGWASTQAARRFGLDIEQRHRDALHSALMTGARLALAKQLTAAAAVDLILGYVKTSVPGAVGKLNPPQSVLENLAKSKLEQAAVEAGKAIGTQIKNAVR